MLTPPEILRRRFRRRLLGYSVREVQEFLHEVSEAMRALLEENRWLQEERERLTERLQVYESLERQLKDAVLVAERVAEEVKQTARREADLIVAQARHDAARLREEAEQDVRRALSEVERLRHLRHRLEAELRHLLQTYLELLEQAAPLPAADASDTPS